MPPAPPLPEDIRQVIAAQKTVPEGIMGLLRAVTSQCYAAINADDFGQIKALADSISNDPKAWSDAIMANTPHALETAGPAHVPTHMGPTFAIPGSDKKPGRQSPSP